MFVGDIYSSNDVVVQITNITTNYCYGVYLTRIGSMEHSLGPVEEVRSFINKYCLLIDSNANFVCSDCKRFCKQRCK